MRLRRTNRHPQLGQSPPGPAGLQAYFGTQIERYLEDVQYRVYESAEQGHGRLDERSYDLSKVPKDFGPAADWPQVKA